MGFLVRLMLTLKRDRRGATAVEYGFILALIFLAIVSSISELANGTIDLWNDVSTKVEKAH